MANAADREPTAHAAARARCWHFGPATLDERSLVLTLGGQPIEIDRKPLQVLLHLLEHAGEVVTKDELVEAVWPGRVISDATLTKSVARLRDALRDDDQSIIKTQHGYGYRLVAVVSVQTAGDPAPAHFDFKPGDHPPHRGLWRLTQRLGSGGHGEVWLALHEKTGESRVYKFALDAAALSSLKREITLYRLLHDSLGESAAAYTRILDWNLEDPPYFIEAEYVAGGSLDRWAEGRGGLGTVPLSSRIDVAIQIADALAGAHSVGVLHKDLKPGNVLVDADGELLRIKLTDFGSGGVLDRERLQRLGITQLGFTQTVGIMDTTSRTPLYLAPEIFAGQPASVRGDIYGLGVLLYQLVVGDFKKPLAPGWERDVADETLRSDIAQMVDGDPGTRIGDAAEVARRLRMLDQRRAERAAQALARTRAVELQGALERARARRGWIAAVLAALSLGLATTTVLYLQVRQARDSERAAARTAEAVNKFLVEDLIKAADPVSTGRSDIAVREVLDGAAAKVAERFADAPVIAAAVHLSLGTSYLGLSEYSKAEAQFEAARTGGTPAVAVAARLGLADLYSYTGELERSDAHVAALLAGTIDDVTRVKAQHIRFANMSQRRENDEALAVLDEVLPLARATFGEDDPYLLELAASRASLLQNLGRFDEAIAQGSEVLQLAQGRYGPRRVETIGPREALGFALFRADRLDEAIATFRENREVAEAIYGARHDRTTSARIRLGISLQEAAKYEEAEPLLRQALQMRVEQLGLEKAESQDETRSLMSSLARLLTETGRGDDGLQMFKRIHAASQAQLGAEHPETLGHAASIGRSLQASGRLGEAEALQKQTVAAARKAFAPGSWRLSVMLSQYADSLSLLGRHEEAELLHAEAVAALTQAMGSQHGKTQQALRLQAQARERRTSGAAARARSPTR